MCAFAGPVVVDVPSSLRKLIAVAKRSYVDSRPSELLRRSDTFAVSLPGAAAGAGAGGAPLLRPSCMVRTRLR